MFLQKAPACGGLWECFLYPGRASFQWGVSVSEDTSPFPSPERQGTGKRASCCYILQGFTYVNNLQKLLDGNYNAMNTTGFLQFRRTISVNEILGMALLLLWFTSGQPQSVFLQVRGILWNGDSARAFSQDP